MNFVVSGEEANGVTKSSDAKNTVDDESNSIFTKSGTGKAESSDVANDGSKTIATKLAISDFSKLKGSDATKAEGVSLVTKSATLVSNGEFKEAESEIITKSGTGKAESSDVTNDGSKNIGTKLEISDFSKLMRSDATKAEGVSLVTKSGTLVSNGELKVAESERVKKKKDSEKSIMLRRKRNINGEDDIESKSRINLKQLRKLIHNISFLTSVNPDLLTADAVKELTDAERATQSSMDVTGQKSKETEAKSDATKDSDSSSKNFGTRSTLHVTGQNSKETAAKSDATKDSDSSSKNFGTSSQSETKIPSSVSNYSKSNFISVVKILEFNYIFFNVLS